MELSERILLSDAKLGVKERIDSNNESMDSFSLLMHSFAIENGLEYEKGIYAKTIYSELEWNEKYFDVINSFYVTYCSGLVNICNKTCNDYKLNGELWRRKPFTIDKEGFKVLYSKDQKVDYYYMKKATLADKMLKDTIYSTVSREVISKVGQYNDFAALCHCVANFMPCPDESYNSVKGLVEDVKDYFPLMIDKIQQCIDNKEKLIYKSNGKLQKVDEDRLIEWHDWFVKNREIYCLEPYYNIQKVDGRFKIMGIPLFQNQSLVNSCPTNEDEVKECLNEIIKRIRYRAKLIVLLHK